MTIHHSILDTIGNTPIVKLNNTAPEGVELFVKLESFNPGGSVKDRLALSVILDAEAKGELKPGDTIIECTSGNVGIALAMVAAARCYKFIAVMGDNYSMERRKLIRALGGEVILIPGHLGSSGGNKIADELARENGWFRPRQFENPANPSYHRMTTASEILSNFAGKRLDYLVTGFGTSGTLTGVGQMLKLARPDINIVVAEPENAQILAKGHWEVHQIQGWTPDFVPSLLDRDVIDSLVTITGQQALETARLMAAKEGILVGISAGATIATAMRLAQSAAPGSVILAMAPDTGERYLSTELFNELGQLETDPGIRYWESALQTLENSEA
ncbi:MULTISPECIES: cysteine synthase A [Alcaligenes]|uniref:Cysteine synthase n=1 Tax=Alcaligenes ammonioxydans TaxID=2582914 RepID=A0ABX8STH6_9BURK|nr:cysteine synthase A [Alcaligenes ammonioxydans]QBH18169.1 cysteine synthase A [Alcaligenes faecalis]QXX79322.1 cysteine synthase A [Alcaligenes ammonioxydans]